MTLVNQPPDHPADPGGDSFTDKLTIQTPEQTLVEFPLAGLGSRFLACLIDTLILMLALIVLAIFAGLVSAGLGATISWGTTWFMAVMLLIAFTLFNGYFAFFEALWNGQTPGKRLMQLRVIQQSGRPLSVYQAIARNLLRIVDQMPFPFYSIGCVTVLLNRQNKRLGDFVAGTVVVREKMLEEIRPEWGTAALGMDTTYDLRLLGDNEFQLIEKFLQRRSWLDATVRQRMAWEIVDKIAARLTLSPDALAAACAGGREQFLEALVQQYRNTGHLQG